MTTEHLQLVSPTVDLARSFRQMAAEYAAAGEGRYQDLPADFAAYVARLLDDARGVGLQPGWVASTTLWLVRGLRGPQAALSESEGGGREVIGVARIRHELNDHLLITGGHIGYDIRPSQRRKGYGRRILALAKDKARQIGIARALVTCDVDNVASARIIEANGGVLADVIYSEPMKCRMKRYWIDL